MEVNKRKQFKYSFNRSSTMMEDSAVNEFNAIQSTVNHRNSNPYIAEKQFRESVQF